MPTAFDDLLVDAPNDQFGDLLVDEQPPAPVEEPVQSLAATAAYSFPKAFSNVATGTVGGIAKMADTGLDIVDKYTGIGKPEIFETIGDVMDDASRNAAEVYPVDERNPLTATIAGGAAQGISLLAGGALGKAAGLGNAALTRVPLALGAAQGANQGIDTARELGVVSPEARFALGALFGGVEVATEKLGGIGNKAATEAIVSQFREPAEKMLKDAAKAVVIEGLEEIVAGSAQDWLARAFATEDPANPGFTKTGVPLPEVDPTTKEFLTKRGMEFLGGAAGGGVFAGAQVLANAGKPEAPPPPSIESGESVVPEFDEAALEELAGIANEAEDADASATADALRRATVDAVVEPDLGTAPAAEGDLLTDFNLAQTAAVAASAANADAPLTAQALVDATAVAAAVQPTIPTPDETSQEKGQGQEDLLARPSPDGETTPSEPSPKGDTAVVLPAAPTAAPAQEPSPPVAGAAFTSRNAEMLPDTDTFGGKFDEPLNINPNSYVNKDGIETVEYTNPRTGDVDVYISAFGDKDFIAYMRQYDENGNPTNRWTSKLERRTKRAGATKAMMQELQSRLPAGHQYTEDSSVSTDGLRFISGQLRQGYVVATNPDGSPQTSEVAISGESITNDLPVAVDPNGKFENIRITSPAEFAKVKKYLGKMLESFGVGLNENNVRWENGTAFIDLPVLQSTTRPSSQTRNYELGSEDLKEIPPADAAAQTPEKQPSTEERPGGDIRNLPQTFKPTPDQKWDWEVADAAGGTAFGNLKNGVADIIGMEASSNGKRYSEPEKYLRRGFFRQLVKTLQSQGAKTLKITMQSGDTRKALARLVETGELVNPRGVAGISVDEHPTTFDIPEPSKNVLTDVSTPVTGGGMETTTTQRDATKPEQMSPEEMLLDAVSEKDADGNRGTVWLQRQAKQRGKGLTADQREAAAAEEYAREQGYQKQGDLYVFQPETPPQAPQETTPQAAAETGVVEARSEEGSVKRAGEVGVPESGKYSVYQAGGRWLIQQSDKRGFGDQIVDSEEEAIAASTSQQAMEKANKEFFAKQQAKADAEKQAQEAKDKPLNDYLDTATSTPMQRGKLKATLNEGAVKNSSTTGKTYKGARFQVVSDMVDDGYVPVTEEVDAVQPLSGQRMNRMDNREQAAYEKKRAAAGKKTQYSLEHPSGGSFIVTKAEHDLAKHLQSKNKRTPAPSAPSRESEAGAVATSPPGASPPVVAASTKETQKPEKATTSVKTIPFTVLRENIPGEKPKKVEVQIPVMVENGVETLTPEAHQIIDDAKWPDTPASPFHASYAEMDYEKYFSVWGDESNRDQVRANYRKLMEGAASSKKPLSYEGWKFDIREPVPAGYQKQGELYIFQSAKPQETTQQEKPSPKSEQSPKGEPAKPPDTRTITNGDKVKFRQEGVLLMGTYQGVNADGTYSVLVKGEKVPRHVSARSLNENNGGAVVEGTRFAYAGEKSNMPKMMRDSLEAAKAMAAAGKSREEIRAVTGWFPGFGKGNEKLRYEVPDEDASWTEAARGMMEGSGERQFKLGDILNHPAMFAAYPELAEVTVSVQSLGGNDSKAEFIPYANTVILNRDRLRGGEITMSSLLHEAQHWVQYKEGFARGGSPEEVAGGTFNDPWNLYKITAAQAEAASIMGEKDKAIRLQEEANKILEKLVAQSKSGGLEQFGSELGVDGYLKLAGEYEARDIQARQNYTPEKRKAIAPYSSENIAEKDAIVMFGSGTQASINALPTGNRAMPLDKARAHVYNKLKASPRKVRVINEPSLKFRGRYDPDGTITLNSAYLGSVEELNDVLLNHESIHDAIETDAKVRQQADSLLGALTEDELADIEAEILDYKDGEFSAEQVQAERQVEAIRKLTANRPDLQSAWGRLVESVSLSFKKLLGVNVSRQQAELAAARIVARGLKRLRKGKTGGRTTGGGSLYGDAKSRNQVRQKYLDTASGFQGWENLTPRERTKVADDYARRFFGRFYAGETLSVLGVRRRKSEDSGARPGASAERDGQISFDLDFDRNNSVITGDNSSSVIRFVSDAVDEEMIHLAEMVGLRNQWIKAGKPGTFPSFMRERNLDIFDEMLEIAKGPLSQKIKDTLVSSWNLYFQDDQAVNVDEVFKKLAADRRKITPFTAELVRQMIQIDRTNLTTETGYQKILGFIKGWLEASLNALRSALPLVKSGSFGKLIKDRIAETEAVLAQMESDSSLYAASPSDVTRFKQLTASIPPKPTPEQLETWKQEHPAEYKELEVMRERVLREMGYTTPVLHGTDAARNEFDGGAFFTDSPSDASAYAEMKALEKAVDANDDLSEIVSDILSEEGGEVISDLGPKAIRDIADANGIDIESADGVVLKGSIKITNPLDLTEYGTDVGNLKKLWNELHANGLVDEAWDDIEEEFQDEMIDKYRGKALYRLLEEEGIQAKAFAKGHDAVVFEDISPDGGSSHTSWLTKSNTQFKSSNPLATDDSGNLITPEAWGDETSPDIRYGPDANIPGNNETGGKPGASELPGSSSADTQGISQQDNSPRANTIREGASRLQWGNAKRDERAKAVSVFARRAARDMLDRNPLPDWDIRFTSGAGAGANASLNGYADGKITVTFDTDPSPRMDLMGMDAELALAFAYDTIQEEVIHALQYVVAKNAWVKAGKPGTIQSFIVKRAVQATGDALARYREAVSAGNTDLAAKIKEALLGSWNLYRAGENNPVFSIGELESRIAGKPVVTTQYFAELTRQLAQLTRQDFTTETGWLKFKNMVLGWFQDAIDSLKAALPLARGGQLGPTIRQEISELETLMKNFENGTPKPLYSLARDTLNQRASEPVTGKEKKGNTFGVPEVGQIHQQQSTEVARQAAQAVFNSAETPVTPESRTTFMELMRTLLDPRLGPSLAQDLIEAGNDMAPVALQDEMATFALRAAAEGDVSLLNMFLNNVNRMSTGTDSNVSKSARELAMRRWAEATQLLGGLDGIKEERDKTAIKSGVKPAEMQALQDELDAAKVKIEELLKALESKKAKGSGKNGIEVVDEVGKTRKKAAKAKAVEDADKAKARLEKQKIAALQRLVDVWAGELGDPGSAMRDKVVSETTALMQKFVRGEITEAELKQGLLKLKMPETLASEAVNVAKARAGANKDIKQYQKQLTPENTAQAIVDEISGRLADPEITEAFKNEEAVAVNVVRELAKTYKGGSEEALLRERLAELPIPTDLQDELVKTLNANLEANKVIRSDAQPTQTAQAIVDAHVKRFMPSATAPQENRTKTRIEQALRMTAPTVTRQQVYDTLKQNLLNNRVAEPLADSVAKITADAWQIRRSASIAEAVEKVSAKWLLQQVLKAPVEMQQSPNWRQDMMAQWLSLSGFTAREVELAVKVLDKPFGKALADARLDAAERYAEQMRKVLGVSVNGRARLKKAVVPAIERVQNALRTGSFEGVSDEMAKWQGWKPLSAAELKRLNELDAQIKSSPSRPYPGATPPHYVLKATHEMFDIFKQHVSGSTLENMAIAFHLNLLSGLPTAGVNIIGPPMKVITEAAIDIARAGVTLDIARFQSIANALKTAASTYFKEGRFTAKYDISDRYGVTEITTTREIANLNYQLDKWLSGLKQAVKDRSHTGILKGVFGISDIVRRFLTVADTAGTAAVNAYSLIMGAHQMAKDAGVSTKNIRSMFTDARLEGQRAYSDAVMAGYSPEDADTAAIDARRAAILGGVYDFVSPEKAFLLDRMAKQEGFLAIGRKPVADDLNTDFKGNEITDRLGENLEGGLISRHLFGVAGMNDVLEMISRFKYGGNTPKGKALSTVLGTLMYGLVHVPYRASRHFASYSPYGFIRYGVKKLRDHQGKENWFMQSMGTPEQEQTALWRAAAGTALMALIASLFRGSDEPEEKDKDYITVTGNGPPTDDPQVRDAWIKQGNQPYHMRGRLFGVPFNVNIGRGGEVGLFAALPFAVADDLAIRDKIRGYKSKEYKASDIVDAFSTYVAAISQKGGLGGLIDLSGKHTSTLASGKGIASAVSGYAANVIPLNRFIQTTENLFINPPDKSTVETTITANIPLARLGNFPALNRMGDPVGDANWLGKISYLGVPLPIDVEPTEQNKKVYEVIHSKMAAPGRMNRVDVEKKYGELTNRQWYDFVKASGGYLSKRITDSHDKLMKMSPGQVDKWMAEVDETARARAANGMGLRVVKVSTVSR